MADRKDTGRAVDKAWFEMRDEISRRYADAVWIPLRTWTEAGEKKYGELGYRAEFVGVRSVAVHMYRRDEGEKVSWSDTNHEHGVLAHKRGYVPAESYRWPTDEDELGVELVLEQQFGGAEPRVWHLNQDLVFALRLLREGDVWVCPSEGYLDVVCLSRGTDGREASLTIRSEFLRDYLAARSMALRLTTYRSRDAILEDCGDIGWTREGGFVEISGGRFDGRAWDIHEGGAPFGAAASVFHMSRTDVDFDADVPTMGPPNDENVSSSQWIVERGGRKLCRVLGEFWRDEWVEPAKHSPRVRGDKIPSTVSFVVSADGERASADDLKYNESRWLWFSPQIVGAILALRGASLVWYTHDTGALGCTAGDKVHFGLNEKDLITAFAPDVAGLPEWQRRIWGGFNVAPDGKVSRELLASQVHAKPAVTQAPEDYLGHGLEELNAAFQARWGKSIIRKHEAIPDILRGTHRFRAMDKAGLLALAKDLARLTADSFDVAVLHELVPLEKGEKRGSLKSLERVLATLIGDAEAHRLMSPLVGVYELRLGDAHMPSSKLAEAFALVGVDGQASSIRQGVELLSATVSAIWTIARIVARGMGPQ